MNGRENCLRIGDHPQTPFCVQCELLGIELVGQPVLGPLGRNGHVGRQPKVFVLILFKREKCVCKCLKN